MVFGEQGKCLVKIKIADLSMGVDDKEMI